MGSNRQTRKISPVGIAVTASVVFHAVLALIALPVMMKAAAAMAAMPNGERKVQRGDHKDDEHGTSEVEPIAFEIEIPQFVERVAREELRDSLLDYLRTTQSEDSEAPERAAFQSDRNTLAASELPPADDGTVRLPSQSGVDLPVIELAHREYVDGEIADDRVLGNDAPEMSDPTTLAKPNPAAVPETEPSPLAEQDRPGEETLDPGDDEAVAEEASPRELEDPFAQDPSSDLLVAAPRRQHEVIDTPKDMETEDALSERRRPRQGVTQEPRETYDPLADHRPPSIVSPALRPGTEQAEPDIFQPQTRRNELRGTISNRGAAAADAVATPMGKYMRKVTSAIEKEWNRKRVAKSDFVTYGNIRLKFYVDHDGNVRDLQIENPDKANPIMQDFTLSAVLEAPIPPIPKNLLSDLTDRRLPVTYDIIIY